MLMDFGWYPKKLGLSGSRVRIATLPDFEEVLSAVHKDSRTGNRWVYPELVEDRDSGPRGQKPLVYAPRFELPCTHVIEVKGGSNEEIEFGIVFLGFLLGMHLLPKGWGYLRRTTSKVHQLIDAHCYNDSVIPFLEKGLAFWNQGKGTKVPSLTFGAVHWYLYSQSYEQQFERFAGLYTVLDSCWRIACELNIVPRQHIRHACRAHWLGSHYGLAIPRWAVPDSSGKSELATIRNELIHDAHFGGKPIGFAFPQIPKLVLQLRHYCARLILAMVGIDCEYVHSSCETRGIYPLRQELTAKQGT
jgi:hypothetical protein